MSGTESTEHSDEAVHAALKQVFRDASEEPEPEGAPAETQAPVAEETAASESAEHSEPSQEPVTEDPETPAQTDAPDIDALRAEYEQKIADIQAKANQSVEWARGIGLKSASEADALKKRASDLLARIKRGEEVDQSELEALTSPGQAASTPAPVYQTPAPSPFAPQAAYQLNDQQMLDYQQFAIASGLADEQIAERVQWMSQPGNLSPRDAALAQSDLYGFLKIGNSEYERAHAAGDPNRAKAAKAAARVQKTAAKAASAASGRGGTPAPPDTSPKPPDFDSMPDEQRWEVVSKAMRQIVEDGTA